MPQNSFPQWPPTPWWKFLLARVFGERIEGSDGGFTVVSYKWRGKIYVTGFRDGQSTSGSEK